MFARFIVGAAIALGIVILARRAGTLASSGAVAAFVVGTVAIGAGWSWGALVVTYFLTSSALSRYGAAVKETRTGGMVEKGGERDAVQVLANGALFTVAAALSVAGLLAPVDAAALGAGTLAASASDTWATEVGTLSASPPRSIVSGRAVAPGTSGGVTFVGTLAAIAGAAFVALTAATLRWPASVALGAFVGGCVGSTLDSLLGATVQARRWCERCGRGTERMVHDCGALSRPSGGVSWLGNDAVNLISSAVGGLLAMLLAR